MSSRALAADVGAVLVLAWVWVWAWVEGCRCAEGCAGELRPAASCQQQPCCWSGWS